MEAPVPVCSLGAVAAAGRSPTGDRCAASATTYGEDRQPRPGAALPVSVSSPWGIPQELVGKGGVEPPRPFGHTDLNRARLPFRHLPWRATTLAAGRRRPGGGWVVAGSIDRKSVV